MASSTAFASFCQIPFSAGCPLLLHGARCTYTQREWKSEVRISAVETILLISLLFVICIQCVLSCTARDKADRNQATTHKAAVWPPRWGTASVPLQNDKSISLLFRFCCTSRDDRRATEVQSLFLQAGGSLQPTAKPKEGLQKSRADPQGTSLIGLVVVSTWQRLLLKLMEHGPALLFCMPSLYPVQDARILKIANMSIWKEENIKESAIPTTNKRDTHYVLHLPLSSTCTFRHRSRKGEKWKSNIKTTKTVSTQTSYTYACQPFVCNDTFGGRILWNVQPLAASAWKAFVMPISHLVHTLGFVNAFN